VLSLEGNATKESEIVLGGTQMYPNSNPIESTISKVSLSNGIHYERDGFESGESKEL
jgi:hypothetical protein